MTLNDNNTELILKTVGCTHPEMEVHVLAALALAVLLVLLQGVLHVRRKHAPHRGGRQLHESTEAPIKC